VLLVKPYNANAEIFSPGNLFHSVLLYRERTDNRFGCFVAKSEFVGLLENL
jgi:hypothetical protein